MGRARERDLLDVTVHDLRDFTTDRHRTVDDAPYGGGPGMVLKVEPFLRAIALVRQRRGHPDAVILMSPQGQTFTHEAAVRLSRVDHVVLLCGRYQGVDERVREQVATEELSIGDYVLSGGELAAAVVIDAVSRQVPGVVGNSESVTTDSFVRRMLDYPTYTRPARLQGHAVPEVLVSGDHGRSGGGGSGRRCGARSAADPICCGVRVWTMRSRSTFASCRRAKPVGSLRRRAAQIAGQAWLGGNRSRRQRFPGEEIRGMKAIEAVERDQLVERPDIRSGDTVRVSVRVTEGEKERIQVFEGVVIGQHRRGAGSTLTVRKVSFGQAWSGYFPCTRR